MLFNLQHLQNATKFQKSNILQSSGVISILQAFL